MGLSSEEAIERTKFFKEKIKVTSCDDNKPYLFVSYKSDDWKIVYENIIYKLQEKYHLRIFCDNDFEKVNDSWIERLKNNLKCAYCRGVIAFISERYITSYATLLEVLKSQDEDTTDYQLNEEPMSIIPVSLSGKSFDEVKRGTKNQYTVQCRIKSYEWDCINESITSGFERAELDDGVKELTNISKEKDLRVKNVVTTFSKIATKVFKNENYYVPNNSIFIENLYKTIKSVDEKFTKEGEESVFGTAEEFGDIVNLSAQDGNEINQESRKIESIHTEHKNLAQNTISTEEKTAKLDSDSVSDSFEKKQNIYHSVSDSYWIDENTTLEKFANNCEDEKFCMKLREVRKSKGIQASVFDFFMASLLRGCDATIMQKGKVVLKAKYNYCKYVVSKNIDTQSNGFGASQYTWSSNSRKAMRKEDMPADFFNSEGKVKSGQLGEYNDIFEKLSPNMTIGEVLIKYKNGEKGFVTKDNNMIFESWKLIKEIN